jgi:hypothetical protein
MTTRNGTRREDPRSLAALLRAPGRDGELAVKIGDRIKLKVDGVKRHGVITEVNAHTEMIDVTIGGVTPGGPPPDKWRKFMPGMTTTTITVELEP